MTMKKSMSVAAVLVLAMIAGVSAVCPPPGYDSVEPFSLEAYVADGTPWFVQQQVSVCVCMCMNRIFLVVLYVRSERYRI